MIQSTAGASAPLVTKTPLLEGKSVEEIRAEILEYFHSSFTLYESIFECLASDEGYYRRANPLRHPLIFYYGHTSVFFINKLNVANLIDERVDPVMESTLAVGVDEMSWDDLNEAHYNWPTPTEVKAHRDKTREIVDRFIRECDFSTPVTWDNPMWIILMGIEHERIHLETTSILIRELPLDMVKPHPIWGSICNESGLAPTNELLDVEGGQVELGKSRTNPIYGWDNEYGYSASEVKNFKASKYLVSNYEFNQFVEADGYKKKEFWTEEGWDWVTYRQASHPVYWLQEDGEYKLRLMLETIDMPWDWPAEVNYLEAKAFCNWKSKETGKSIRLPTEAEWYQLRNQIDTDQPYWEEAPGNINLEHYMSPCPVTNHRFENGFFDVLGNVWQWTETPIDGYDGFEIHPIYDDFSAPTFDGKHNLFKGGCWISTGNYAIKDSRYAFRRHFFQYSGIRYVEAEQLPEPEVNIYETDQMVARYIESHFGDPNPLEVENFLVRTVSEVAKHLEGRKVGRALDIGCAAARSAYELAQYYDQVDAVDSSVRLIEAPANLQKSGRQRYVITDEGELQTYREILLENFEGYTEIKDKISFMQGDACNLVEKYDNYDLVFASNVVDRLYDPEKFLNTIKTRINDGGLLVIACPNTWMEEYTPRDRWLGGFKAATGESFTTLEGIEKVIGDQFKMIQDPVDVPFVIRETSRKYCYAISQLTIWEKIGS
ncbi:MAG: 5-histidylcysteine sulfoxide synthase [Planctomycetota bacterium]